MPSPYAGDPNNYPSNISRVLDGEPRNAVSVNTPYEELADRTAWLAARRATAGDSYWTTDSSSGDTPDVHESFTTNAYAKGFTSWVEFPGAAIGDVILVDLATMAKCSGSNDGLLRVYKIEDRGGGSETETALNYAKAWIEAGGAYKFPHFHIPIRVAVAGNLRVGIEGKIITGSGTLQLLGTGLYSAFRAAVA